MFVSRAYSKKGSPAVLILDGHGLHKELKVILYPREHYIHMISLPPHTTHKLQPLDRTIMRPFKAAYNEACTEWMNRYRPLKIAQRNISWVIQHCVYVHLQNGACKVWLCLYRTLPFEQE